MIDNGPCFSSREFHDFLKNNCAVHMRSAPYHPFSNGMAERTVQTVKHGVKKMTSERSEISWHDSYFSRELPPTQPLVRFLAS